jgi:predicted O-methyltransferase YrrM
MKFWTRGIATATQHRTEQILEPLPEQFRSVLLSMYSGQPQRGSNGELYPLDSCTRISPEQGMWLYGLCRKVKPKRSIEVGLAYGFSTTYFLAAIHENGSGTHISIDFFQEYWHGIGLQHAKNICRTDEFCFINKKSFQALADLAQRGERFEINFIDGGHRFDDTLVNFTLSAELCPLGGYVILDDMWMASIRRVVSFIRNNRQDFQEVATSIPNIAAFQRRAEDNRDWKHYINF